MVQAVIAQSNQVGLVVLEVVGQVVQVGLLTQVLEPLIPVVVADQLGGEAVQFLLAGMVAQG